MQVLFNFAANQLLVVSNFNDVNFLSTVFLYPSIISSHLYQSLLVVVKVHLVDCGHQVIGSEDGLYFSNLFIRVKFVTLLEFEHHSSFAQLTVIEFDFKISNVIWPPHSCNAQAPKLLHIVARKLFYVRNYKSTLYFVHCWNDLYNFDDGF